MLSSRKKNQSKRRLWIELNSSVSNVILIGELMPTMVMSDFKTFNFK